MRSKMMDKRRRTKRSKFSSEESGSSSMSSSMTSSSSSDEKTDAKDLKPIKEYLSNRKELASQLFKSVKSDKIRMMLPQILKKIEFSDLEELCANELTGMSKARIMSILNGQEMLQSSDTEDSNDSGPSLEIISDTEWLSDDRSSIKVEGAKSKKDSKKSKKLDTKSKSKSNEKGKNGKLMAKVKLEKVKTEGKDKVKEKAKEKEKEGESLLDLLELEMRARAIKALLRKEDDPSAAKSGNSKDQASGSGNLSNTSVQARQANLKEQLEKIDVLMKHGDDEDVYVVINPAPTIELLSSDDEKEGKSKKAGEKLDSEILLKVNKIGQQEQSCTSKENENGEKVREKEQETVLEKLLNIEGNANESTEINGKKGKDARGKEKAKDNGNSNLPMSVIESNNDDKVDSPKETPKEEELEEGEIIDNEDDEKEQKDETKADVEPPPKDKIKKVKKNPNIRLKNRRKQSDSESDSEILKKPVVGKSEIEKKATPSEPIEIEDSPERIEPKNPAPRSRKGSNVSSKLDEDDDKALDIEEIINLDDYPDDMDEPEKAAKEQPEPEQSSSKQEPKHPAQQSSSKSETWASRYVQQDEVQSVIRESKIQSEIRKRLRERQRQSKLNNSPKEPELEPESAVVVPKPTGSVEEYLALKRLADGDLSALTADESSSQDQIELPIETPAVIVKKPLLILPPKVEEEKVETSVVANEEEHQQPVVETAVVENPEKITEKNIIIKADSPLKDKRVILLRPTTEESKPEPTEESKPDPTEESKQDRTKKSKQDPSTSQDPNSDSSDDNITVKIDSSSWTDTAPSELRPD